MPISFLSFFLFALFATLCSQHAVDKGPELAFVGEAERLTGSEMLDPSPMTDLRCPESRSQLDHKGAVGGQRYVFLGHETHSLATNPFGSDECAASVAFTGRWTRVPISDGGRSS